MIYINPSKVQFLLKNYFGNNVKGSGDVTKRKSKQETHH